MAMRKLASAASMLILTSCASVSVFEVPKVEQNLSQALQRTEAQIQMAQSDYQEKRLLLENLARANSAGFNPVRAELHQHLTAMHENLAKIDERRKAMQAANSDVVGFAYHHKRILSTEPDYVPFDETVKRFDAAVQAINSYLTAYSQDSNALTDQVAAKKLYKVFTLSEFQERVRQNIKTAQTNIQSMQSALNQTQDLVNGSTEKRRKLQSQLSAMEALAKRYTERAQDFNQVSHEMSIQTADAKQITSLDPSWPRAQKQVLKLEKTAQDLADINAHFQKVYEHVRPNAGSLNQSQ